MTPVATEKVYTRFFLECYEQSTHIMQCLHIAHLDEKLSREEYENTIVKMDQVLSVLKNLSQYGKRKPHG